MRQRYVCVSEVCGQAIELITRPNGVHPDVSPICGCGAAMKKAYSKPVLFKLTKTDAIAALHSGEEQNDSDRARFRAMQS